MSVAKTLLWIKVLKSNLRNILFAVKVGLAGGSVYYIADQGVWKDSKETTKLYRRINETIKPYVQEAKAQLPVEVPELPSTNRISFLTKHYWNEGVTATFTFIGNLPTHVVDWSRKGIDSARNNEEVKKFLDSFSSSTPALSVETSKEVKQ